MWIEYLMGALAVASVTFTIAITSIFKSFREWISTMHPKLEELVHCPWCQSFWFLAILLCSWDIPLINLSKFTIINFLLTLFSMWSVIGLVHFVLLRTYQPVAAMMARRQIEKLNQK